jgi:hypothetical protein
MCGVARVGHEDAVQRANVQYLLNHETSETIFRLYSKVLREVGDLDTIVALCHE